MAVHLLVSALFFTAISLTDVVNSFSIRPTISDVTRTTTLFNNNPNNEYQQLQSRKQILNKFLSSTSAFLIVGCATTATTNTPAAYAVDGDVKWITGKAPKIEGKKPNDPNDVKGTRKDPNFLRSISDCKVRNDNMHSYIFKNSCIFSSYMHIFLTTKKE